MDETTLRAFTAGTWALGVVLWPYWKLVFAFVAGAIGSAAYITALYFRFIGENELERGIVLKPFLHRYSIYDQIDLWKGCWYSAIGGAIAVVFQFDVQTFVAVQSFILGATWPAVTSQFLSGKMTTPAKADVDAIKEDPKPVDLLSQRTINELVGQLDETTPADNTGERV